GAVCDRVRQSTIEWARTGQVTGLPEGLDLSGAPAGEGMDATAPSESSDAAVQFKAAPGGARPAGDPAAVRDELGTGQPLDGAVRSRMESAFGHDFSSVRVHTDPVGSNVSRRLNARALTVGDHVAFDSGEYQPGTMVGDALIAHELAHVVQQGAST